MNNWSNSSLPVKHEPEPKAADLLWAVEAWILLVLSRSFDSLDVNVGSCRIHTEKVESDRSESIVRAC